MKLNRFGAAFVTVSMLVGSNYTWAEVAVNKAQAAEIAQKQYGGKVLKVSKVSKDGKDFFSVRLILDDGRVKTLKIEAK